MSRSLIYNTVFASLVFAASASTAVAQDEIPTKVTDQNRSGDLPFSTTVGTGVEHVVVSSGNLTVNIPIAHVPGRGMDFNYVLRYDGRYLVVSTACFTGGCSQLWKIEKNNSYLPTNGIWQTNNTYLTNVSDNGPCYLDTDTGGPAPGGYTGTIGYMFHAADGSKYPIEISSQNGECPAGTWSYINSGPDSSGTGIWANLDIHLTPRILTADGTLNQATCGANDRDSNGNQNAQPLCGNDTLGRSLVTQQNGANYIQYSIKDSSGTSSTYTVNYTSLAINTQFGVSGSYGPIAEYTGTRQVISSVVLPNGRSYSFQYDGYGSLNRLTLPTGATVSYTWANYANGQETYRYVASRTLYVNGQSYTWQFSQSPGTSSDCQSIGAGCTRVIQTDPVGNQSVYIARGGVIASAKIYQGAATGTPLRQYFIDYSSWNGQIMDNTLLLPIRITTQLENGLVSKKEFDYENFTYTYSFCSDTWMCSNYGPSQGSGNATRGNVSEIREYDWAQGAPGPLIRRTDKTYLHNSNSNYLAQNIVDKVLQETIYDGSSNQKAQTQYEYDNYIAGQNALISTSSNQAPQHDYTNYSSSFIYRGNTTRVKKWRNTDGAFLTTTYTYDDLGNTRALTDSLNNTTSYSYTDRWSDTSQCQPVGGNGQAYVTLSTNALSQNVQFTYFSCTGLRQARQDQNDINASRAGTTHSYDLFGRVTQKNNPDGGQIATNYSDVPPISVTTTTKINPSQNLITTKISDGLGRVIQTQLTSDPQGTVYTDTTYDALGQVHSVSNPYRTGNDPTTTAGTTTYAYDALGRKISDTYPDNSILTTAYCGPSTLVTDPTGKWRRSTTDAIGRLVEVDEPNAPGASVAANGCPGTGEPIWVTSYTNDALGNLTQVVQNGSHQRNFTYDSLSRLLTSSNPETGTITYKYDSDANCASPNSFPTLLVSKTDARGIRTCAQYDALNRITQKSYSDGATPTVAFLYDVSSTNGVTISNPVGRLVRAAVGSCIQTINSYDPMGRVKTQWLNTPSYCGPASFIPSYTYDLAGNTTSITYPSGRIVNYTYDSASRPKTAADGSNGITYATDFQTAPTGCLAGAVCYTPQGTFYALSIGQSSSFTGLNLTHSYNSRLQPNEFNASSTGGNAIDITYSFIDPSTSKNADHVNSITNNLDTTRSQTFSYDQLNRITSALTSSTYATSPTHCWGETYQFDNSPTGGAWGNLTQIAATTNSNYTGCSQESGFSQTADGNNHLSGFGYDASGNTSSDGVNSYTWDAESQLSASTGVTYAYDAQGRRVSKSTGKNYVYGLSGEILAETDSSGNTTAEYVFFGGKRVAMLPAGGNPIYYIEDLLGTSRVLTDASGVVCYDADFYPYGGERSYTNTCPQNYKFEGKERDTETGNDDFGARYYSNRFGRWLSADWSSVPVAVPYANLSNPQTLNLYAMVSDDPESFADLDGHDGWDIVKGVASGINDAVNGAYNMIVATAKDPFAPIDAAIKFADTGVTAYETSEGRQALAAQFDSLSTQDKTAVVTGALIIGGLAGAANAPETDTTASVTANRSSGLAFENKALATEGLTKNTTPMEAVDPKTGKTGTTIPDAQRANGQTVDAKNVKTLSDSPQLRRQSVISAKSGQKAQVLVNKNNIQKVSPTVQNRMNVKKIDP